VTRGWIGAGIQELTPELAGSFNVDHPNGVLITEIVRNSPAEQAGMKTGDILTAIDSTSINDWSAMLDTIANLPPGKAVAIKLVRNGTEISLPVKIGKRPKPKEQ
jgi:serine protease DegQ